jgi:hypothetical protein
MSRLNFSSLNDAWGVPDNTDIISYKHSYKKPKEIGMTINSNEIKNSEPIKETYSGYIKPCSLVEEHISKCEICRNKLLENISPQNDSIVDKLINQTEHMTSSITQEYLDTNFNIAEHFENISPSQKNLIIIVLYGILIILISDLIIKEKNE